MENRRPRGRPKIYTKDQIKEHRTRYILNTGWYCRVCERWYTLAGKWSHLKTDKHINNYIKTINEM